MAIRELTNATRNTVAYTHAKMVTSCSPLGYRVGSSTALGSEGEVLSESMVVGKAVDGMASDLTSVEDRGVRFGDVSGSFEDMARGGLYSDV